MLLLLVNIILINTGSLVLAKQMILAQFRNLDVFKTLQIMLILKVNLFDYFMLPRCDWIQKEKRNFKFSSICRLLQLAQIMSLLLFLTDGVQLRKCNLAFGMEMPSYILNLGLRLTHQLRQIQKFLLRSVV